MLTPHTTAPAFGSSAARKRRAFALVENMVAIGVIAFALAAVYTLNEQCIQILRSAKDEGGASQVLQERIEQLRIANWSRLTDDTWIRDNIINAAAPGSSTLNNLSEYVKIAPYNSTTTATNTFQLVNGVASSGSANTPLVGENTVQVQWTVTWTGVPRGKPHTRQTIVLLGKGGVAKY